MRFIPLLLLLASSSAAFASGGFPKGSQFPDWFSVAVDVPKPWGGNATISEQSSFRVTFENKRQSEIQILNLNCIEPHFWVIEKDGTKRELPIKLENLTFPTTNPGLTIGAQSQIGFEVQMKRPPRPAINADAKLIFEIRVDFVMGEVIDLLSADGSIHSELNGFEYDVSLKLPDAQRLLSETKVEQPGAAQPATQPADKVPAKDQPSTPTSKVSPR